ncbi:MULTISPECIES: type II secretory pathway protein [Marinobacter]|uniref:Type II secretory pathway component PulD-like n=1 Tax=Marinobacter nauticus (strain ATCC 700491 / DSM 11845 / VT8) TaxID=351348 RepID=A1U7T5_MARN8|nr:MULTISPECIES: type II secretory pathway protein [Marinobacter]ABM21054.1 Type II secretory pathway component PulD-like [Marinobacter nauticus VT8]
MNPIKTSLFAVVTSITLAGCAAWMPETNADRPKHMPTLEKLQAELLKLEQEASKGSKFKDDSPWLVAKHVGDYQKYDHLEGQKITIAQYGKTLPEMVVRLSEEMDVNIFLASDLYLNREGAANQGKKNQSTQKQGSEGGPRSIRQPEIIDTSNVMTLFGATFGGNSGRFDDPLSAELTVKSEGQSASDLLDNIAAQLGISWKYDEVRNRVTFYRLDQENFQVFFPGIAEAEIDVGRSGDRDSVIRQNASYENESGSWEEIAEGVQALLSPFGKATIVKGTGNIVVVDTPEAMESVTEYIEKVNDVFGRQVYLQIRTAAVSVESANDFNVTWNNILNTVNSGAFELSSQTAEVPTQNLPNVFNVIRTSNGASLALELLASELESTEVNEQAVTTLSNQPTSLKVLTETGYISGISQQDATVNADNLVSDVQTDTVNIGFDATLLPRVISESRLQLQVALELSSNLTLVNFDSTIVQTPTRDRNSVVQRAWLRNGETWVLAAFNSSKSSNQEQGTGDPGFWGLGGGTSKSKEEQILLVMITPHIQEGVF